MLPSDAAHRRGNESPLTDLPNSAGLVSNCATEFQKSALFRNNNMKNNNNKINRFSFINTQPHGKTKTNTTILG